MRILFIGGTGNISAECAALLHREGHEIYVISRGRKAVPSEYQALPADRKDPKAMRAALRGAQPEVVINFLGYEVSEAQTDCELFQGEIRQYIFISSTTVCSRPTRQVPLTEDAPLGNQFWEYAQKKLACERWLKTQWDHFPVTIVRPSHTYSRRWVPNPIASSSYTFASRIEQGRPVFVPDDGENRWTLTAASDFAQGLAGLVANDEALGEIFHITSDEVLTWNEIYREIGAALGVARPAVAKIPTDYICEIARN
jgi:nucleoside-diphosphate-sugar epimerase